MALDIYYKEDIENALRAIEHSTRQALPEGGATEYQKGFNAALASIALAFGLTRDKQVRPVSKPASTPAPASAQRQFRTMAYDG